MNTTIETESQILVAYDGSADADLGLAWAIRFAVDRHRPIEVVAASGDIAYLPERTTQEAVGLVESWMERAAATLKESAVSEWTVTALPGKIVTELIEASRTASLVVLGAQGHGVVGGVLLGSVSQHVSRHAHCPVVVVRGADHQHRRIVVGVDGSEASAGALAFAFEEAELTHSTLVAVHGRGLSATNGPFDIDVAPAVAEELEREERMLAEMTAGLRAEHPDVEVELRAVPVPAIRALADHSEDASLVVVGTRGRGGFLGLLLGSVSATVLQHAKCPVAVIR